ncbi:MAG TPA: aminoglycoside phosphotransferase family protein [Terriglobia bacterium]|nr:aminoglycoside phosphotransferase family protein [Terriglobia bacterium]
MSRPNFQLTAGNAKDYLAQTGLVLPQEQISIRELGGGVSNVVLLLEWPGRPGQRWVVKQSLGKLRVKDDWRSDRERIFREANSIQKLHAVLPRGSVPEVVHIDRQNFIFIMAAAPPGSATWKDLLLSGQVDSAVAAEAGKLLASIIVKSRQDPDFQKLFEDRTVFDQLRIDPYYRTTAARCPEAASALQELMRDSWQIRTALVHGDYSPKNILVLGSRIFLIDFEVVHWGDPAFDSGFLLNHLLLKAFHQPQFAEIYLDAAGAFRKALVSGMGPAGAAAFERMTVRHLGALMLARIDGKSPVEYIQNDETKGKIRIAAKRILLDPPQHLNHVFQSVLKESLA